MAAERPIPKLGDKPRRPLKDRARLRNGPVGAQAWPA